MSVPPWKRSLNQVDSSIMEALRPSRAVVGFNSNGHLLTAALSRRQVVQGLGWISSQRVVAPDGFVFDYREQELAGEGRRDEIMGEARRRARSLGLQFNCEIVYGTPASREASEAPGAAESPATVSAPPACAEPWKRLLFDVGGDAFICCIQKTNEVLLGNAPNDAFEEIWNGRRARLVRETMFGSAAPACCAGCYRISRRSEESRPAASPAAA